MRRTPTLVLPALGLVLVGCSVASADRDQLSEAELERADVVIVAEDMRFTKGPTTLPTGETRIALVNDDGAPHDVTIDGVRDPVVDTPGGAQAIGSVTLEPGSYTFYCSVGGHRSAGMEFDVTVE